MLQPLFVLIGVIITTGDRGGLMFKLVLCAADTRIAYAVRVRRMRERPSIGEAADQQTVRPDRRSP